MADVGRVARSRSFPAARHSRRALNRFPIHRRWTSSSLVARDSSNEDPIPVELNKALADIGVL